MQSLGAHLNCASLVPKARPWSMPNQCPLESLSSQKELYYDPLHKHSECKGAFPRFNETVFSYFALNATYRHFHLSASFPHEII